MRVLCPMQIHHAMVTESPATASSVLSVAFDKKALPEKSGRAFLFGRANLYFLGGFLPPDFLRPQAMMTSFLLMVKRYSISIISRRPISHSCSARIFLCMNLSHSSRFIRLPFGLAFSRLTNASMLSVFSL